MLKVLVPSLLVCSFFAVTPAFALTGHEAAVKCENTPGCYVSYEEGGGVVIFGPKGGVVMCTGPTAQCVAGIKTNAPRRLSLHLLQTLESAPDTTNGPPAKSGGGKSTDGGGKSSGGKSSGGKSTVLHIHPPAPPPPVG